MKPMYPLAQSCLKEFDDLFANDLPLGFLPLRRIKHQIDLLLGAPLLGLSKKIGYLVLD